MDNVDRRTLLLGSAGLLLAGCSGSGSGGEKPSPKGPNIVKPRRGNVVTPEDTAALRDRLNTAFKSKDVEELVKVIEPGDFAIDDVRKRWNRRFDNFDRLGFIEGEWYVGVPGGRTRNAAGGVVEYDGDLVFAHQVKGCDAQQVVESYRATFRKKTKDAPLELMHLGEADSYFDPSIWDVAKVDVIGTKHAWIVFREEDAAKAKAFAGRVEAGAKRAFSAMPDPKGVSKLFYAITWPEIDGKLWGGIEIGEADANEYYHPFLDPDELARGQKKSSGRKGLPLATGRAGLHQATFTRPDFVEVAAHEGVHILADQWNAGGDIPTWAIEGLAEWGARGSKDILSTDGARIRAAYSEFMSVAAKDNDAFHKTPREYDFYQCSAAVYAYLEDKGGRDAVYEVAETFYSSTGRDAAAEKLGRSEKDLLTATRKWLGA
jgi:hypothetical protein